MVRRKRTPVPKGQHGGAREGGGRSPLYEEGALVVVTANVTAAQRDRLAALGGAQWLRDVLDRERQPTLTRQKEPARDEPMSVVSFRLTLTQRATIRENGGAPWLRQVLDRSIAAARRNSQEG